MAVEIKPSVLREQVEQGMKLDTLAEYYGLPKSQMKKALQQLGLKIRRFHEPKFVIVSEEETSHHNVIGEGEPDTPQTPYNPSSDMISIQEVNFEDDREEESIPERISRESESLSW